MKKEIKLARTGADGQPLRRRAVFGEEVIDEEIRDYWTTKTQDSTRWYVIRPIITEEGYVVGIGHLTCWPKEHDEYLIIEAKNRKELAARLRKALPNENGGLVDKIDRALIEKEKNLSKA